VTEILVINTGPLITFARIGALEILEKLPFAFVSPEEVRAELDEGHQAGYPQVAPPWLRYESLRNPVSPLAVSALDRGEAAVIQLAIERNIAWVCIDEWKGRRAALSAGLKVTGVLGLLGMAKRKGIIPAVRPFLDRAIAAGIRYDAELVDRVLRSIGE
jgi:predicted nucleic acid-binding protein